MRYFIVAALIAAGLAATAQPSLAKSSGYRKDNCTDCRPHASKRRWKRETIDDIIARDLDPAGTYANYPSWARKALAPKGDGGRS